MSNQDIFRRMDPEEERDLTRLARLEYGPDLVNASMQRWNSYTDAQKDAIIAEGNAIYQDIARAMQNGLPAIDTDVQRMLKYWHDHIRYFYEPTVDILRGLGETYALSPDFRANFEKIDPDLPEYLQEAVAQYVDDLETDVIAAMIAEDEARLRRLGE